MTPARGFFHSTLITSMLGCDTSPMKTTKNISLNLLIGLIILCAGKNENGNLNGFANNPTLNNYTEEKSYSTQRHATKIPLKLVMDPRGVVQDVHSQGITYDHNSGMLSPDKCAELISALHTDAPKGKGSYHIRSYLYMSA